MATVSLRELGTSVRCEVRFGPRPRRARHDVGLARMTAALKQDRSKGAPSTFEV
jgi:hypothetical protein